MNAYSDFPGSLPCYVTTLYDSAEPSTGSRRWVSTFPVPRSGSWKPSTGSRWRSAPASNSPLVLTVGSFHAGTANNVIPAEARLGATVRAFSAEAREWACEGFIRVAKGIAAAHEVDVEVDYQMLYPVTVNDPAEVGFLAETAGIDRFCEVPHPFPGSEDFSFVLDEVPGAFAMVGACPPGTDPRTAPANHAPEAAFDEDVLEEGAVLLAALARGRLLA